MSVGLWKESVSRECVGGCSLCAEMAANASPNLKPALG